MKWIVPAVVLAIAALIVFQVIWLMNEAKVQEQDDRKRITEAIHEACDELEKQEAIGFIGNSFDSVFMKHPFPDRDSMNVRVLTDSLSVNDHSGMHQVIVIDDSVLEARHPIPPPPIPPMPPGGHVQFETPVPAVPEFGMRDDSAEIIIMRSERMKNAVQDVMMQYVFSAGIPRHELSQEKVDSSLRAEFDEKGISYSFTAEIVHGMPHERMFRDSAGRKDSAWTFRAPVFRGDPSPFPTELIVTVDPGKQSPVMRILPQIAFAALLTIGMFILFLSIYKEALRQKKIGDIRRDFINNMTHEFKTPLATMSLAADTIMNEKVISDPDKVRYYAEQIKNENRKLNQQVEKVLELSLAEKKGVTLHKEDVGLVELIRRAVESMQLQVQARGGTIHFDDSFGEMKIQADPFHLERVFLNLIDNAMKYGGQPPVIQITIENYRSGVQIHIADNGKGIPKEEWNTIFEPFHRVSTGDIHNVKGFGLGLSYAQSVVKEHNGSISVSKSSDSGTTITITLMHRPRKSS